MPLITLLPESLQFNAEPDESILDAALRHDITLPYSCRDGVCGACKAKIISGEFSHGQYLDTALSPVEKAQGYALLCCSQAHSDLQIESRPLTGIHQINSRVMPCRIKEMTKAAADVMIITLQLPANEVLQFHAGQYISVLQKDKTERMFSLANPPHQAHQLELHIRHIPGGRFTSHVFSDMQARDILRFKGPQGTFFLREDSTRPIILVASGTGFAPIKSIIEQALYNGNQRPIHLYWGGRRPQDLYLMELAESWQDQGINFTPVLSEAQAEDNWSGRSGLVHQAVMQDYPDLSAYEIYACGSPLMIEAASHDFSSQCKLPAEHFFADAFTVSKS